MFQKRNREPVPPFSPFSKGYLKLFVEGIMVTYKNQNLILNSLKEVINYEFN